MLIKIILISFFAFKCNYAYAQSLLKNKDAKKVLKSSGISEKKAKEIFNEILDENEIPNSNNVNKYNNSTQNENLQLEKIYQAEKSINQNEIKISENNTLLEEDNSLNEIVQTPAKKIPITQNTEQDKYFGYNIFSGNPEIFQQSINESVDPNYLVSPGDEIIVMLWGETELYQNFTVSRDGYIFLSNVGQVFVNGLTVSKIEIKLRRLLKKVYSTLGISTFFDISLGAQSLRPLRIIALGEISQPGAYNVSNSTTLFSSLFYFNGSTVNGSLREISLIRNGEKIKEIDYYDYLLRGVRENDIQLQRDDVVFIPTRGKSVKVSGEINRPGIYELKKTEKLGDLINFSGGLLSTTFLGRAKIERILPAQLRKEKGIDRTIVDINLSKKEDLKNIDLVDGDFITFFKISESVQNIVSVSGSISRPGDYELDVGMTISGLIEKAGGLVNNTFSERE